MFSAGALAAAALVNARRLLVCCCVCAAADKELQGTGSAVLCDDGLEKGLQDAAAE